MQLAAGEASGVWLDIGSTWNPRFAGSEWREGKGQWRCRRSIISRSNVKDSRASWAFAKQKGVGRE
jgi:hypothetical protein